MDMRRSKEKYLLFQGLYFEWTSGIVRLRQDIKSDIIDGVNNMTKAILNPFGYIPHSFAAGRVSLKHKKNE